MTKFKDKMYLIPLGILMILMFLIFRNVFIMGDDFNYIGFASNGFSGFIANSVSHYMVGNGRLLVHVLLAAMLIFEMMLFKIIGPIVVTASVFLVGKIADKNNYAVLTAVLLYSILSINITSEAVYNAAGFWNYIFPIAMMLWSYYLLQKGARFLPLVCFFAAVTVELVGIMVVGMLFLYILHTKFILKEKISKTLLVSFILSVAGYTSVVLAPGNFYRYELETQLSAFEIINMQFRPLLDMFFVNRSMTKFVLLLSTCTFAWLIKYKKNILAGLLGIFCFGYGMTIYLDVSLFQYFIASFAVIFLFSIAYVAILILKDSKDPTFMIFLILALGAHLMQIVSPLLGYRQLLPTIYAIFVLVAYTVSSLLSEISLERPMQVFITATCCLIAALSIQGDLNGYRNNVGAHLQNVEAVRSHVLGETIMMQKLHDNEYGWFDIETHEGYRKAFLSYYGADRETEVEFFEGGNKKWD